MKIYDGIPNSSIKGASSLSIGVFDGVHRGHKRLLNSAVKFAETHNFIPSVITFDPHPSNLFTQERMPLVSTIHQRLRLLEEAGIKSCYVVKFNRRFASISKEAFVENILVKKLKARYLCVGSQFRFGFKSQGDLQYLKSAGKLYGFRVNGVKESVVGGHRVSSTLLRSLISQANFKEALKLMGQPYIYEELQVSGRGRGKSLGIPTINLKIGCQILPIDGVYAAWIRLGKHIGPAAVHIGKRPTFNDSKTLEIHMIDPEMNHFPKQMKGKVGVLFLKKIRNIKHFRSEDSLIKQIHSDVNTIKKVLISKHPLLF